MILEILAALLVGAIVAAIILSWETVQDWLEENKTSETDYYEVLAKAIENDEYTVVANVINRRGAKQTTKTWDSVQLDDGFKAKLKGRNKIEVRA